MSITLEPTATMPHMVLSKGLLPAELRRTCLHFNRRGEGFYCIKRE